MQLYPELGAKGMMGAGGEIVKNEGAMALTKGLGATAVGYFVQGWFKFGGFEFFKVNLAKSYGDQGAWDNRFMLNSAAAAAAEFIADIFLCPLEATRIRQVGPRMHLPCLRMCPCFCCWHRAVDVLFCRATVPHAPPP